MTLSNRENASRSAGLGPGVLVRSNSEFVMLVRPGRRSLLSEGPSVHQDFSSIEGRAVLQIGPLQRVGECRGSFGSGLCAPLCSLCLCGDYCMRLS